MVSDPGHQAGQFGLAPGQGHHPVAQSLKQLGSDAQITIVPDKGHGDLLTPELRGQMRREMSAAFTDRDATK